MYFSPTYIFYNKINKVMEGYSLPCLKKKKKKKKKKKIHFPGERSDTDLVDNISTEIITRNNGRGVIIDEWE